MLGWLTQGRALARYRLNRIILHCGSACFHLSQLHMGQRKGVNTPGLEVPVRLSPLLFTAVVRAWFRLFLLLRRHRLRSLRRIFPFPPPARDGYARRDSRGISGQKSVVFSILFIT